MQVVEDTLAVMARDRDLREERRNDLVTARLVAGELIERARSLLPAESLA